jgi:hypothetical protein
MANLPQRLERLRRQAAALARNHVRAEGDALSLWWQVMGVPPDEWQRTVLTTDSKRVILNNCRQSGKSQTAAIKALHTALAIPGSLTLVLSPSLRQSQELALKIFRGYQHLGRPVAADSETSLSLTNNSRIVALPGADPGRVRGFSQVALLLLDEASRCSDELYYSCRPMISVSGGSIVMMSTPHGRRGFFHQTWTEGEGWLKIAVPGTECPRLTPAFLAEERIALGDQWFRQEYGCSFEDVEDTVFDYDLVQRALDPTVKPLIEVSPSGEGVWVGSLD